MAAAEEAGLPLLTVPDEVPFIAVTKAVFDARADEQREVLHRAFATQRRLTAAAAGDGLRPMLAEWTAATGVGAAVLDPLGRLLATGDRAQHTRRRRPATSSNGSPHAGCAAARPAPPEGSSWRSSRWARGGCAGCCCSPAARTTPPVRSSPDWSRCSPGAGAPPPARRAGAPPQVGAAVGAAGRGGSGGGPGPGHAALGGADGRAGARRRGGAGGRPGGGERRGR
ncbi:hypothetical protein PQR15_07430 [Streptomyces lydicus]|nr:hypothetical protein [Streptomyces lydicus]